MAVRAVPGFWVQQAGRGPGTLGFRPRAASLDSTQEGSGTVVC